MQKHFKLLGHKAKDKVTGTVGIVTSLSFDLYGCVQVVLDLGLKSDGTPKPTQWFDVKRLTIVSKKPSMTPPDFNKPEIGSAIKPGFNSQPVR